jgi:predicted transcriptional regulator YdeE
MEIAKFKLMGLKLPGKTSNLNNQSNIDCAWLWQKFQRENIFEQIPNKVNQDLYAVYFDYGQDPSMAFSYFLGCLVVDPTPKPAHLDELEIPLQQYLKVTAKGTMTACITQAWQQIWDSNLQRKFGFDFEIYDERSQDWNQAEVDLFVSLP